MPPVPAGTVYAYWTGEPGAASSLASTERTPVTASATWRPMPTKPNDPAPVLTSIVTQTFAVGDVVRGTANVTDPPDAATTAGPPRSPPPGAFTVGDPLCCTPPSSGVNRTRCRYSVRTPPTRPSVQPSCAISTWPPASVKNEGAPTPTAPSVRLDEALPTVAPRPVR